MTLDRTAKVDGMSDPVGVLQQRGVCVVNPAAITVDPTVNLERIAPGVILHPGCRLTGAKTAIGPGCVIGAEGPVTLDNCQLGRRVHFTSGYAAEATFLNDTALGGNAHVRAGTLLEEESGGAHSVGLKQTILFPYTVLGSLINFCDVLMAGGTSRVDHGEVGSGYVHFNYTPHRDKATASLIGDVPRGVLLDQPAVFLGGQGGLVGPVRVTFGVVVPAGTVLRKDVLESGLFGPPPETARHDPAFQSGAYKAIRRIVVNNLLYIGNVNALRSWYRHVRGRFMSADPFQHACWVGALERLDHVLEERIRRLRELAEKMPHSLERAKAIHRGDVAHQPPYDQQQAFIARWPALNEHLTHLDAVTGQLAERDRLLEALARRPAQASYLDVVKGLEPSAKAAAVAWLQTIVEATAGQWAGIA